jgi:Protein of unknown function (DUF1552)
MTMGRPFTLGRRAVLRGALGSSLALPLLEIMRGRRSFAQTAAPKRFVLVYCGIPPVGEDDFDERAGGVPQFMIPDAAGPLTAPFKVALDPLEAHGLRQDTTVISSMRIPRTGSGNGRRYGSAGFHYETMGPIVSGVSDPTNIGDALGPSADWVLADKIGAATRFPSLVYMAQAADHSNYGRDYISWRPRPSPRSGQSPTLRNDPVESPRAAFDRLFTGFTPPTGGTAPPPPDPELLRRKDILTRVRQAYTRLQPRLGVADRSRLDEHLENVRTLEQRLIASLEPVSAGASGRCAIPTRPGADPAVSGDYANEDLRAAGFVDLIHMAFACDLTRVVSLELTSSMSGVVLPTSLGITYRNWDGKALPPAILHEATHGDGDNLTVAECVRWHVKHLANLAKKLKDTPDVNGNMLDNTVIAFVMEAGLGSLRMQNGSVVGEQPPHTSEGMVAAVVGGRNLGMQLGNHLVATGQHPASVLLSGMRAVGGPQMTALGEITTDITGLRV